MATVCLFLFIPVANPSAATDKIFSQSYADSLEGRALADVIAELGSPDDLHEVGEVKSVIWQDAASNTLILATGLDGSTVESVLFSELGDVEYRPVNVNVISAYEQVEYGMSYEEVLPLLGGMEGQKDVSSTANFGGFEATTEVYTWMTPDFSSLSLGFNDNQLVSKSMIANGELQYDFYEGNLSSGGNLTEETAEEEERPVQLNLARLYERLDYGISYEEAVKMIGKEGIVWSLNEDELDNYEYPPTVYAWMDEKGTVLSLVFVDDELESKTLVDHGVVKSDFNSVKVDEQDGAAKEGANNSNNDGGTSGANEENIGQTETKNISGQLPNTSTNMYNYLVASFIMIVMGSVGLLFTRKSKLS